MTSTTVDRERDARVREMLRDELDAAWLYDRLADGVRNETTARTLRDLAKSEREHARHWAERLDDLSLAEGTVRPAPRTRVLAWRG